MKLIIVLVVFVVLDVVCAGGDDPCGDPTIPFNKSDILLQLRNFETILRYFNSTTFERINDTLTEPSLSVADHLQNVIFDYVNVKPLYVAAGIETNEVDLAISSLVNFINSTTNSFPSDRLKNIEIVQTTVLRSKQIFASVLATTWDTIAPEIPIPVTDLQSFSNNTTTPVSFPLSCIYDDLKYLTDFVSVLNSGIEDFGNLVLAMIYVTQ